MRCEFFRSPDSRHEDEKGERKVGYVRDNLFILISRFESITGFNKRLLDGP